MIVWSLFIIDLMGLFFYTKIGSIISIGDLPTTNIIEPIRLLGKNSLSRTTKSLFYFSKSKSFNEIKVTANNIIAMPRKSMG